MISSDVIRELLVVRDQYGYWTHPCFFNEEINISFEAWAAQNQLTWKLSFFENEANENVCASYYQGETDINGWVPFKPAGYGWFIGSIHDTEEGPVCVWLCPVREKI
ncbi:hypothetical protein ACI01E_004062 [Cronobacter turicensis]